MTGEFQPVFSFRPRNTNECLDLAMRYFGRFLPGMLGMWLLVAIPASGLVYLFAQWGQLDLRLALLVIYFATLPLGVLLMNDAVPRIFGQSPGESASPRRSASGLFGLSAVLVILGLGWAYLAQNLGDRLGLSVSVRAWSIWAGVGLAAFVVCLNTLIHVARSQRIDWRTGRMFFLCLCLRSLIAIGPALVIFPPFHDWRLPLLFILTMIPGIWLALRTGFVMEQTCLYRLDPALCPEHVGGLFKEETGNLFGRMFWISNFSEIVWLVLFVTLDAAATLIFRTPILLGQLGKIPSGSEFETYLDMAWELLVHDPLVLASLTATALLVYTIHRLAWFFCYIDIRVRRDCWDLELKIAGATRQLAGSQTGSNNPAISEMV